MLCKMESILRFSIRDFQQRHTVMQKRTVVLTDTDMMIILSNHSPKGTRESENMTYLISKERSWAL